MKMARWVALFILLVSATPALAQEYFYNDGLFVGLGAQASIMNRDRGIHYGFPSFCGPTPFCVPQRKGFSAPDISDTAASPTMTVGWKFNDWDAVSLKGDWAHYSVSRNDTAPDSTGFIGLAVDGFNGVFIPPGNGPTNVRTSWDSDAFKLALEYQRRLTKGDLGGLFALLGVKMRYENQSFDAKAVNATLPITTVADSYHETLKEWLYGPYGGLKLAFKPDKDSRWNFDVSGNVGWYFKSASFDGHDKFFNGQHFSQSDHSKDGTLFAGAALNIVYAINRNWFLDAGYEFSWIQFASHIFNAGKTPAANSTGIPSRITSTQLITHAPGIKLIYKFD